MSGHGSGEAVHWDFEDEYGAERDGLFEDDYGISLPKAQAMGKGRERAESRGSGSGRSNGSWEVD